MTQKSVAGVLVAGVAAAFILFVPVAAYAQLGSVHGRVVDEAGKPVPDADVTFDRPGDSPIHFTGKTDSKGEYTRSGLRLGGGNWTITVTKGPLSGRAADIEVPQGNALQVPDIVIRAGSTGGAGKPGINLAKIFSDAQALVAQNNFDGAITTLTGVTDKDPKCAQCFVRIGDTYYAKSGTDTADDQKQADLDKSEKAYLQVIALGDQTSDAADAYGVFVTVYNSEKKFDEAGAMNQKATALLAATAKPGAGGGNDATAAYNAGVILWNQSKMTEAEAQFAKAIQLKPDMAEAHYYYGMCLINEGKVDDAKKSLQQYLKLAPSGPNAEMAKNVLDTMK